MSRGVSRRTLLKAAGPVLLGAATACARDPGAIEIFVLWSGGELATFQGLLTSFEQEYRAEGYRTHVVPAGFHLNELLRARVDAGNPPDIVVDPSPGQVIAYARRGWAKPIDPAIGRDVRPELRDLVTDRDGKVYGLHIKAAHKSLIWYRPSALGGRTLPTDWDGFLALVRALVAEGRTPLSVAAGNTWTLTDWLENALVAGGGGDVYERLAAGEADAWLDEHVGAALERLGDLWSIPGVFPGGPAHAALTEYEESVFEVFARRRADLVFEADFVKGLLNDLGAAGDADSFRFPPTVGSPPPLVVGGDIAMLMTESAGAVALVEWLSRPAAFEPWIAKGGFLSPNRSVPVAAYPSGDARRHAEHLHSATAVHFDLSDRVSGGLVGIGRGIRHALTEFFAAVTTSGANRAAAVQRAQQSLRRSAELAGTHAG